MNIFLTGTAQFATATLGTASTTAGALIFHNASNGNASTLAAGLPGVPISLALPATAGTLALTALPSYTVATLPAPIASIRMLAFVSDGTANKRLAICDGSNWRWPDGAIVS